MEYIMNELTSSLKKILSNHGADLVGIGDLSEAQPHARKNMPNGICVAIAIKPDIIKGIEKAPTNEYFNAYHELNAKLDELILLGTEYLHKLGYEAFPQTRAIVSENQTEYSSILPHKTIATRAGIGWIGKCALLVTKYYGSAIRISSILTNAPLDTDSPINKSFCGECMICTRACPAQAVKGINWSVKAIREEIFDPVKCRRTARAISKEVLGEEITLCGKCIEVCPYTQAYLNKN
jgi:epoxyqueuosine reductase